MPLDAARRTYRQNQKFYLKLQSRAPVAPVAVAASVLLLSGCQDDQLARDGMVNGAFTAQLLRVWRDGAFKGSYRQLHEKILACLPSDQTPNLLCVGAPDPAFLKQPPFTI